jgi:hypothetical protein
LTNINIKLTLETVALDLKEKAGFQQGGRGHAMS